MKAKFKITNPDVAECTLSVTMPLDSWKRLREQLDSKYPSWELRKVINHLICRAEEIFETEGEFES